MADNTTPQWRIETEYVQNCNCDFGCPCNFNALPTYGNCEALVAYHIRKGYFNHTILDGVTFAWGLWWPKAIHLGEGIGKVYVDTKASSEQVKAIEEITSGKYGGGVFAIFPSTFKEIMPAEVTDIDFHYDPFNAGFTVKGAGAAQSQHIVNAKTGAALEAEVWNRDGFVFKKATVTSVDWYWRAGDISLRHEKKNGHISIATYSNDGCVA